MHSSHPDVWSVDFPEYDFNAFYGVPVEDSPESITSSLEGAVPLSPPAAKSYAVDGIPVGYFVPSADDAANQHATFQRAMPPNVSPVRDRTNEGQGLPQSLAGEEHVESSQQGVPHYFGAAEGIPVEECGYRAPSTEEATDPSEQSLDAPNATQPAVTVAATVSEYVVATAADVSTCRALSLTLDISSPLSPSYLHVAQALYDSGFAYNLIPPSLVAPQLPRCHLDDAPGTSCGVHDEYAEKTEFSSGNDASAASDYESCEGYHTPKPHVSSVKYLNDPADCYQYPPETECSSVNYTSTPEHSAPGYPENLENVPPFSASKVPNKDDHHTTDPRPYPMYHTQQPLFFANMYTPAHFAAVDHVAAETHTAVHRQSVAATPAPSGQCYTVSEKQQNARKRKGKDVERGGIDKPAAKKAKNSRAPAMATTSTASASDATAEPKRKNKSELCSLAGKLEGKAARDLADSIANAAAYQVKCQWPACSAIGTISNSVYDLTHHLSDRNGPHSVRVTGSVVCEWPITENGVTQPCGKVLSTGAYSVAKHLQTARHFNVRFRCTGVGCEKVFATSDSLANHLKVKPASV
ncbi:hypothetical protein FB45DRAFT_362992 [Roridomyces roridus]|uniref:C2H2-type domain-containing protein n=1 Tax=Roridomyces roridus TaxID=1738132 RepID=A0AAD7C8E5_9AGAR|nr:hypothetical protein FB45DRAFT_362992 [Roridomyces roridus]